MDALLALFGDILLASAGRLLIRAASFGRWQSEAWSGTESASLTPAGALSFVRDGQRVFTHTGQQFAGMLLVILIALLAAFYVHAV